MAVARGMTVDAYVYIYWDRDVAAQVQLGDRGPGLADRRQAQIELDAGDVEVAAGALDRPGGEIRALRRVDGVRPRRHAVPTLPAHDPPHRARRPRHVSLRHLPAPLNAGSDAAFWQVASRAWVHATTPATVHVTAQVTTALPMQIAVKSACSAAHAVR